MNYPKGKKFVLNHFISYGFQDIYNFLFSAKIKDGRQKWRKLKFFPFAEDTLVLPPGSEINLLEIALSLVVSEIFSMFYFTIKFKMDAKRGKN